MNEILARLAGGDLRSEGRADEVAGQIIDAPGLLANLAEGLHSDDKLVRARTCMTIEVISREHAHLVGSLVPQLLSLASSERTPQARWHLAEVFGNVALSDEDTETAIPVLLEYLADRSKIVRYCAVQTLGILGARSSRKEEIAGRISALAGDSKSLAKAVSRAMQDLGVVKQ